MSLFDWRRILSCLVIAAGICAVGGIRSEASANSDTTSQEAFGLKLANAALAQRWVPVIYDPAYRKISYPGGDVPWYTGVCTDVIVRAYRKLGIDLQEKIHKARVGSGDTNIDHRRVRVMKKYFSRYGKRLSTKTDPSLYKPGDIVTYYLPNGTFSKTHVAIVTQFKTASGVPLIVHNRGLGVQLEDRLFAEKITGHFRYGK